MTDESTVLNNLRTAHYGDWGLDLSSQEVHELWADIEAKEIISSCIQILSSQEVHELWGEIEKLKAENAQFQRSTNDETVSEKFFENMDKVRNMLGKRFTDENPNDFFDNLRKGA